MFVGETIKEIRINKNIRSNVLYKNILSRPAISNFEKGLSDTTVEKFFILLDRLHITLEEFEVIHRKKEDTDFFYTLRYIDFFYKRDIESLKKLSIKAKSDYEVTNNEKFNHYNALITLLVDYLKEKNNSKEALDTIKGYLDDCDNWGYYEITLFTNSLIFFPNSYIDIMYAKVKNKLAEYQRFSRYRNEAAILLFNILEKKIIDKSTFNINFYLSELQSIQSHTLDNMYIQTMIKFFLIINTVILEKKTYSEEVYTIVNFLEFVELNSKAKQCIKFYKRVLEIYLIT